MAFISSCHCGNLSATVDEEIPTQGMTCNCSICRRKGNIHHFTSPEKVTLEKPEGGSSVYTFNTHNIEHRFCSTCGCSPFAEGTGRDGTKMVEINLRCVPECDIDALDIQQFDGASA